MERSGEENPVITRPTFFMISKVLGLFPFTWKSRKLVLSPLYLLNSCFLVCFAICTLYYRVHKKQNNSLQENKTFAEYVRRNIQFLPHLICTVLILIHTVHLYLSIYKLNAIIMYLKDVQYITRQNFIRRNYFVYFLLDLYILFDFLIDYYNFDFVAIDYSGFIFTTIFPFAITDQFSLFLSIVSYNYKFIFTKLTTRNTDKFIKISEKLNYICELMLETYIPQILCLLIYTFVSYVVLSYSLIRMYIERSMTYFSILFYLSRIVLCFLSCVHCVISCQRITSEVNFN